MTQLTPSMTGTGAQHGLFMSPHTVGVAVQRVCCVFTLCVGDSEMKELGSAFKEMGRWTRKDSSDSDKVMTVAYKQHHQGIEPRERQVPHSSPADAGQRCFLVLGLD